MAFKYFIIIHPFAYKFHSDYHFVVPFDPETDQIAGIDLSPRNPEVHAAVTASTVSFSKFINKELRQKNAKYLYGGYREQREIYRRSVLFNEYPSSIYSEFDEPRNYHLGIDIWGPAGTTVIAPIGGSIHSMAYNGHFGDYGATIILQHQIDGFVFYTLYGHLSYADLENKRVGQFISRGEDFAHFGEPKENGDWPPHLHFQIIIDIGEWNGDYPGVCKASELDKYVYNSPDADLVLNMRKYTLPEGQN